MESNQNHQKKSQTEMNSPTSGDAKESVRDGVKIDTTICGVDADTTELKSTSSGKKRKSRATTGEILDVNVKRQRVPVHRFQSPIEELESFNRIEKEDKKKKEDILTLYKKNSFLAVRGAEGEFYICRTAQNIYSTTKRLRIQWLSHDAKTNLYLFDYLDSTEIETVITEITMDKVSKNNFKLPKSEQNRVERILDRAIRVEQGVSTTKEVEDEAMEEQREGENIDDEETNDTDDAYQTKRASIYKKSKSKGGKRKSITPKVKVEKKVVTKRFQEKAEKKKGPDRNLRPNVKIKIQELDPFFETKKHMPVISPEITTKLIYRALKMKDKDALDEMLKLSEGVYDFKSISPNLYDVRGPLTLAGELGQLEMMDSLIDEFYNSKTIGHRKRKIPNEPVISSMNTGDYNPLSLGIRNIRALNASRGNKEGTGALLKKNEQNDNCIKHWMDIGVPVETMERYLVSYSVATSHTRDSQLPEVIMHINAALKRGHRQLAGKYVTEAERLSGYGFNFLHKEVLIYSEEDLKDIILAASVRKKPFSNDAVTPLHCAAINPNPKYLRRLLSIEPDMNIQTRSRARPIHYAAVCERSGPLEFLLERGASLSESDTNGDLPIHWAARAGRGKNIDLLIKHSIAEDTSINEKWGIGNVNRPNRFSQCPLHIAVEEGHLDTVQILIRLGADLNKHLSAGKDKMTPLMLAARNGHLNIVRALVQSGSTIECLDKMKRSALTHAVISGSSPVASYLLYLGADPNRLDSSNNSLVHYASAYGWYFVLDLLINDAGALPDLPNNWQVTPANIAMLKGHSGIVKHLMNTKKIDINFKDDTGLTLTSKICCSRIVVGLTETLSLLINEFKADPTILDVHGCNALHHLAANNIKLKGTYWDKQVDSEAMALTVKMAEVLIKAGCNPTLPTNEGKTPVMLAIEQVNVSLVEFLVQKGGTVSAEKNKDEKTVLHLMAEQCCLTDVSPMLRLLVKSVMNKDTVKEVPICKPVVQENEKIKQKNLQLGGTNLPLVSDRDDQNSNEGIKNSTATNKVDDKTQLDILNLIAHDRDFSGFTPLLRACQVYSTFQAKTHKSGSLANPENGLTFIKELIELIGSDVNSTVGCKNMIDEPVLQYPPEGKSSSLHFMINPQCESSKLQGKGLKLLLKYKPNTNQKDLKGKTPLLLAVESEKEGIVKSLLEAGADPNVCVNIIGQAEVPPLLLAAQRASYNIMKLLIDHKADVNLTHSETQQAAIHILVTNRANEDETIAMIQCLLSMGANINTADKNGDTPLHLAVRANKGHSDASTSLEEFMLNRGSNVFAKNNEQHMPLHLAVNKSGVDPIELCCLLTSFMREQRVDEPSVKGFTPLMYAACSGATICCMHLLQRKAALEAKEYRGNTALNLTILHGHDSCAIMLIQRGASSSHPIVVSLPSPLDGQLEKRKRPVMTWRPRRQWEASQSTENPGETLSLFEMAVKNDLSGVAHMLLDTQGMSMEAIGAALNLSKFNMALRLLSRIPDVSRLHAKNLAGQNLFHILAYKTNRNCPDMQIKVAGALFEKGVSLSLQDHAGLTPLMYAALTHQSVDLAKFLIENDVSFNPALKDNMQRDLMGAFMWDYNWISDQYKTNEVRQWLELLTNFAKVSLDTLYDHPLPDPLLLGARIDLQEPDYFKKSHIRCSTCTTPLIYIIRNYDFGLAKFLLKLGASPNFPDSQGRTPMMHAVQMNDIKMVKLLLNYNYDPDSDSVNMENIKPSLSKICSREVMDINFLVNKDKNPDDLLDEEVNPAEDDAISLSKHTEEEEDSVDFSEADEESLPMEDENEDDSDAGTDIIEDPVSLVASESVPDGATKLMLSRHVSQILKEKHYNTIEKTSNCDLSLTDKSSWTAVHHAVCSLKFASFDNAEIVYLLGTSGAPLEAKTEDGHTALDLAQKTDACEITRVLNRLLAMEPYFKTVPSYECSPSKFIVKGLVEIPRPLDYNSDAVQYLKKLDETTKDDTFAPGPLPDANCEIKSSGAVARSLNIPYDVLLSKVDVSVGMWGMYNFYKMQIIRHKAKNIFVLFTRWGRIGSRGQFQHTPFQTLQEAVKEFCKIFKSKTGNDWNTKEFVNHSKKYRLVSTSVKQKRKKIKLNLDTSLTSILPEPLIDLISEISNVSMFEKAITKLGMDEDIMPFGRIKRDSLLKARHILTEISDLIDKTVKLRTNFTIDKHAEYQEICEEISELTNDYYHLVPMQGFEYDTITPISDKFKLREHTKLLGQLLDIQVANNILIGAMSKRAEIHPIDYIYQSLSCRLEPLAEDHQEAQFILTNVHATVPSAKINRLFRVSRDGENERLASLNLPNHQLLWHGSSMANFLSILSRGLLVTPPEVPWNGHLFGEGIYFADTFVKSANYCHNHSPNSNVKVMLLCEVALGNPKIDVKHGDEDHLDDDINSLKILGLNAPSEDFYARLHFGASLALGQVVPMVYHPPARIQHNEFIVHDPSQVAIRYLMLYNG